MVGKIGLTIGKSLSISSGLISGLVINIIYEIDSGTLLPGAKPGLTLALPRMIDLGGNIGLMMYVWLFPILQGTQFAFLVSLALREMVEMVASAGVTSIV